LCDGRSVSRSQFATLFAVIGTAFGTWDGNSFTLPDTRGLFLRGVDNSPYTGTAGRDPDRNARIPVGPGANSGIAVGSYEVDSFRAHNHKNAWFASGAHQHWLSSGTDGSGTVYTTHARFGTRVVNVPGVGVTGPGVYYPTGGLAREDLTDAATATATIPMEGDNETRPKNVSVTYIIKY